MWRCGDCRRHVKATAPRCPFCGAAEPSAPSPPAAGQLVTTLGVSTLLALASCGGRAAKNGNDATETSASSSSSTGTSSSGTSTSGTDTSTDSDSDSASGTTAVTTSDSTDESTDGETTGDTGETDTTGTDTGETDTTETDTGESDTTTDTGEDGILFDIGESTEDTGDEGTTAIPPYAGAAPGDEWPYNGEPPDEGGPEEPDTDE